MKQEQFINMFKNKDPAKKGVIDYTNYQRDFDKISKCILSSTTNNHIHSLYRLLELFENKYNLSYTENDMIKLSTLLNIKYIEINHEI